jgi:hypothetical protein
LRFPRMQREREPETKRTAISFLSPRQSQHAFCRNMLSTKAVKEMDLRGGLLNS